LQAEICAILACAEIRLDVRSEKYINIFSGSEAAKTTSPLVQQCQKALSDISFLHSLGLFGSPDTRIRGNETADELAREGTVRQFVGPEPAWRSPGRIKEKIEHWMDSQHTAKRRGLIIAQRQTRKLTLALVLL